MKNTIKKTTLLLAGIAICSFCKADVSGRYVYDLHKNSYFIVDAPFKTFSFNKGRLEIPVKGLTGVTNNKALLGFSIGAEWEVAKIVKSVQNDTGTRIFVTGDLAYFQIANGKSQVRVFLGIGTHF